MKRAGRYELESPKQEPSLLEPSGPYAHLTDKEIATRVRMLLRGDLDHEALCTGARDRILNLSQKLQEANKLLERAISDSTHAGVLTMSTGEAIQEHLKGVDK
jgi:hypothetical protein